MDNPPAPPAGRLVPGPNCNARFLYVAGPDAAPSLGACGSVQLLFLRVPQTCDQPVAIHLFDAASGSSFDRSTENTVRTPTCFTLYGGAGAYTSPSARCREPKAEQSGHVLVTKTFDKHARESWETLGQFDLDQGERVGSDIYFKLAAVGLSGNGLNLFRVAVSTLQVEAFTYRLGVNFHTDRDGGARFHVGVPAGTTRLHEQHFDLDWGASCMLAGTHLKRGRNGHWSHNTVAVPGTDAAGRLQIDFVRKWQTYDNVTFSLTNDGGQALPIYFGVGQGIVDKLGPSPETKQP